MTGRHAIAMAALALGALSAVACDKKAEAAAATASTSAAAIGIAECAACGMVVQEQPAPRGQLVHRDGTREHFCSIADLVQYLEAPSPHGKATAIFVEALEDDFDPASADAKARPWTAAKSATFVVGVERENVMGHAALSYERRAQADAAAKRLGGTVNTWTELKATVLGTK